MKCLAVSQNETIIKALHGALSTTLDIEFLSHDSALVTKLATFQIQSTHYEPEHIDQYFNPTLPTEYCIIVVEDETENVRSLLRAAFQSQASPVYVLTTSPHPAVISEMRDWTSEFPKATRLHLSELLRHSFVTTLSQSLTQSQVQRYQRHFANAERVLILLHNDPDPDALASGLALRHVLRRTKTTAILGSLHGVTRPENKRMANLLDIHVEPINADSLARFDRIATVDVQPHYFGGLLNSVDLVIDHHEKRTGYNTTFEDIRPAYGSTATILTEHLRSVNSNISERVATAMLYAIKSDTLFLSRHTNRNDLDAFTFLYPLANPTLIRKIEGAGITMERLKCVSQAVNEGRSNGQVYASHLGVVPREDLIAYVSDFLLQLEGIKWTIVAGTIADQLIICVRNLGFSRDASTFVRMWFDDIGSAGGPRTMSTAVMPMEAFNAKFGQLNEPGLTELLADLAATFLRDPRAESRDDQQQRLPTTKPS